MGFLQAIASFSVMGETSDSVVGRANTDACGYASTRVLPRSVPRNSLWCRMPSDAAVFPVVVLGISLADER
jgi:hypothetical protein